MMNDVLNQALGIYRVEMGQRKTNFHENIYGNDKLFISFIVPASEVKSLSSETFLPCLKK